MNGYPLWIFCWKYSFRLSFRFVLFGLYCVFFKVQKVLIVTQKYHLYRAVYVVRQFGIEAYGLDREELKFPVKNNIREAAARVKDFFYCIAEPEPTYLGEEIPIKTASASLTDDKIKV